MKNQWNLYSTGFSSLHCCDVPLDHTCSIKLRGFLINLKIVQLANLTMCKDGHNNPKSNCSMKTANPQTYQYMGVCINSFRDDVMEIYHEMTLPLRFNRLVHVEDSRISRY